MDESSTQHGQMRVVEIGKDGCPYPLLREPVTARRLTTLLCAALSAPYECKRDSEGNIYPDEQQYEGMTKAEVGALKAADGYANGDIDHTKFVHDRIIGKPKQQIESVNVAIGIKDYLAKLKEIDEAEKNGTTYATTNDTVSKWLPTQQYEVVSVEVIPNKVSLDSI